MPVKILLIDHNDSFTFNLLQLFEEINGVDVSLFNVDDVAGINVTKFDGIVLSAGPGLPENYPAIRMLLDNYHATKPFLGICLGLQEIVTYFGGRLINIRKVQHGLQQAINIIDDDILFRNLVHPVNVGLYHSWAADKDFMPSCLITTATTQSGMIMAVRHQTYPISAVQFHPESYMTCQGKVIILNWIHNLKD